MWWHCGYPPGEARCEQGWQALRREIAVEPQVLRAARPARLARVLAAGGLVPQLRAERLREVATRVLEDFAGDLAAGLARLPPAQAHAALRKFPGIGPPGADRMVLFAGLAPLAAVPSSCPYVLPRILSGRVADGYRASYSQAQRAIEAGIPATLHAAPACLSAAAAPRPRAVQARASAVRAVPAGAGLPLQPGG